MSKRQTPWWHKDIAARKQPYLEGRARVLPALRAYFAAQNFVEVETPALQICPGTEVHIQTFSTELIGPRAPDGRAQRQRFQLHTSPELSMKKLLVAGWPRIFQLCAVFRNGEVTARHSPEFRMLEWYRAGGTLEDMIADCTALVRAAAPAGGRAEFRFNGRACNPFSEPEILPVSEAFERYAHMDLLATLHETAPPDRAALAVQAEQAGVRVGAEDAWDDIFYRVVMEKIEPHLGSPRLTFLTDFPLPLAMLARPHAEDPRLAQRFELFACGLELANAFGELTDADMQRARFVADQAEQQKIYGASFDVDEDFLAALAQGLPESAGCALGFDRLVMLATGAENINDVLWAPVDVRIEP